MENTTIPENFELIVHIGAGKTASTSIQHSLLANKDWLRENNTAYLGLVLENALQKYFDWQQSSQGYFDWQQQYNDLHIANDQDNIDINPVQRKLQDELRYALIESIKSISNQGMSRAIWSNESLFYTSGFIIPVLEQLIALGININIIVYIRRHDAWMRSAYLQWGIKHKIYSGKLKPFREWSKEYLPNVAPKLKIWLRQKKWTKISVRNFDTCGNVVNDFFTYCGLYHPNINMVRSYETPSNVCLAAWAMYNGQFDEIVSPSHIETLLNSAGLLNKKLRECDLNNLLPSLEDIEELKLATDEDRHAVDEIFKLFCQPAMETAELESTQEAVTQNNINTMLLFLLKKQFDDIHRLEQSLLNMHDILKVQTDKTHHIEQLLPNMQNMIKMQADKIYRLEQLLPSMQNMIKMQADKIYRLEQLLPNIKNTPKEQFDN